MYLLFSFENCRNNAAGLILSKIFNVDQIYKYVFGRAIRSHNTFLLIFILLVLSLVFLIVTVYLYIIIFCLESSYLLTYLVFACWLCFFALFCFCFVFSVAFVNLLPALQFL